MYQLNTFDYESDYLATRFLLPSTSNRISLYFESNYLVLRIELPCTSNRITLYFESNYEIIAFELRDKTIAFAGASDSFASVK